MLHSIKITTHIYINHTKCIENNELNGCLNQYILDLSHSEIKLAKDKIKILDGLIPICAKYKKIRDEKELWEKMESYIQQHSTALLLHTICTDCAEELYIGQPFNFSISDISALPRTKKGHTIIRLCDL